MTSHEQEQYELLLDKTFDTDHDEDGVCLNPMPRRLMDLHETALAAGRRIGLSSVPKPTMVCLAIMAGCLECALVQQDDPAWALANTKPTPVLGPAKRRPGRPTNKEREARALAETA